jgi:hypothetical protein
MGWVAKGFGAGVVAALLAGLVSVVAFGRSPGESVAPAALSVAVAFVVVYLNR